MFAQYVSFFSFIHSKKGGTDAPRKVGLCRERIVSLWLGSLGEGTESAYVAVM